MKLRRISVVLFIASAMFLQIIPAYCADDAWLLGTWELSYDPDNSPKDFLTFKENQVFVHTNHKKEVTDGTYMLTKDKVTVIQQIGSRVISASFIFDEEKKILYFTYKGHTSHYTKVK